MPERSSPDGAVSVASLGVSNQTLHDLQEHLCMFFTGYSRNADEILEEQRTQSIGGDGGMIESLHDVKSIGMASLSPPSSTATRLRSPP